MPPDWAPHQATWISWPHNRETWPDGLEAVEQVIAQAVRALSTGESVHINVLNAAHEAHVRALIGNATLEYPVLYHRIPTNDAWCRDHGAVFVVRPEGADPLAAIHWGYNAWGDKYPPYDLDEAVPRRMAEVLGVPRVPVDMVLEGGSVEVNGAGLLLTTEACLLHPNRNPHLARPGIEQRLRTMLGIRKILWLAGALAGDDTDGHIDNLARFVDPETVVAVVERDPLDDNYAALQDNLARLRAMTTLRGTPLRVIGLPMPSPVYVDGACLPASYANFYVGNRVVLLPCYRDPKDAVAAAILRELFPNRRMVGLDCTAIVRGLGAFHCLTQQVPAV
jgi:agmatine deiminase